MFNKGDKIKDTDRSEKNISRNIRDDKNNFITNNKKTIVVFYSLIDLDILFFSYFIFMKNVFKVRIYYY